MIVGLVPIIKEYTGLGNVSWWELQTGLCLESPIFVRPFPELEVNVLGGYLDISSIE